MDHFHMIFIWKPDDLDVKLCCLEDVWLYEDDANAEEKAIKK